MRLLLAAVAALAVAACGQASAPEGAPPAAAAAQGEVDFAFPALFQTGYRMEVVVSKGANARVFVLYRQGENFRFEAPTEMGPGVFIHRAGEGEMIMLLNAGGRQMAMRLPKGADQAPPTIEETWADRADVKPGGPCEAAGERGREFTSVIEGVTHSVCMTRDAIPLWSEVDGERVFEAAAVTRGPQEAGLFQIPAGVHVMDIGALPTGGFGR